MFTKSLALLALAATGALASGSTECTKTAWQTSTAYYPGTTLTTHVDGTKTDHPLVVVTLTPSVTPTSWPGQARELDARGSPCSSYTTTTSTTWTASPDPTSTATVTEWATTVTGEPETITTCLFYTTLASCGVY
ncbi:hypothetical protein EV715DRAFT_290314 [Schizophyllum commune]